MYYYEARANQFSSLRLLCISLSLSLSLSLPDSFYNDVHVHDYTVDFILKPRASFLSQPRGIFSQRDEKAEAIVLGVDRG